MEQAYFGNIVRRLTIEEMGIIGLLSDVDATAAFKAIKRSELQKMSKLTEAHFRKTMDKLTAMQFIGVVTGGKDHKIFVTEYGHLALDYTLEEEEE